MPFLNGKIVSSAKLMCFLRKLLVSRNKSMISGQWLSIYIQTTVLNLRVSTEEFKRLCISCRRKLFHCTLSPCTNGLAERNLQSIKAPNVELFNMIRLPVPIPLYSYSIRTSVSHRRLTSRTTQPMKTVKN